MQLHDKQGTMSRDTWNLIQQSKRFYVETYRMTGTTLLISIIINLILAAANYYCYFKQPENNFYATNGETPPIQLKALDDFNRTSRALLENDPTEVEHENVIPE